jgi:hypothetical protein
LGLIRFGVGFSCLLFSGTEDCDKDGFCGLFVKFWGATNHKTYSKILKGKWRNRCASKGDYSQFSKLRRVFN